MMFVMLPGLIKKYSRQALGRILQQVAKGENIQCQFYIRRHSYLCEDVYLQNFCIIAGVNAEPRKSLHFILNVAVDHLLQLVTDNVSCVEGGNNVEYVHNQGGGDNCAKCWSDRL